MLFRTSRAIEELRGEVEEIKRELRELTVDLPELQRKMVRVLRNTARERARMEELEAASEEAVQPTPVTTVNGSGAPHGLLNPRQKQLQQEILRRRAGG